MTTQAGRLPAEGVRAMFDRIAPVYDVMNRVMTAGLDRRWRAETASAVVRPGDRVLDACCGTGDLAVAGVRAGGRVTGLDFSERMLARARKKSSEVEWVQGDVLELPFEDGSFDAATVGFGVRNVADLDGGARASCGACSRPGGRRRRCSRSPSRAAGSRRSTASGSTGSCRCSARCCRAATAYTYLPASVRRFPGPDDLAGRLRAAGFADVRYRLFAGGIVALHTGVSRDDALATIRESPGLDAYLEDLEERLAGGGRGMPGPRLGGRVARRSRPAASGCGRCSCSSPRPTGEAPLAAGASPSSSCTWRRSSTTT